jgi:magnesium transporter
MEVMIFELSKEYAEILREAIAQEDKDFIVASMQEANYADISTLLEEFNADESKMVLDLLDKERSSRILADLDEDTLEDFLKKFSNEEIASYVDYLDSDDAVDLLNLLSIADREEVIAILEDAEAKANIKDLLRYPEDVAGGLMAKELIKANLNWTVVQCIEEIRRQTENVEKIYSVYVVDGRNKLLGRVSLKKIILAEDNTKIKDIYEPNLLSVQTHTDQREVAEIMSRYDLEAIPVVDVKGKLVGRITIDDVVDVMQEMAEEERQLMTGLSADIEEDDSVWIISKARLPWLLIGLVGGMLGARFIGLFEADIVAIPAVAFFIPLITATGGNVGIQSATLIVQSLASKSIFDSTFRQRMFKGLLVSIINGLVLGLFVFTINFILGHEMKLGFVVSFALFCVVLLASFMGTITPILLDKFGINPALASGPFITTANDLVGLLVYFSVAHYLYGL